MGKITLASSQFARSLAEHATLNPAFMSGLGTQEVLYCYISQSLVSIIDKSKAYKSTLTLLGVVYIRVRHSVALNSGIKLVSSVSMHLRL